MAGETNIGTERYLGDITRNTIFFLFSSFNGFKSCLKTVGQNAAEQMTQLYEDLEANGKTVRFLDSFELDAIKKLGENLAKAAGKCGAVCRQSVGDIIRKVDSLKLNSFIYMRDVENALDDIKHISCVTFDREKRELVERVLGYGLNSIPNQEQRECMEKLFGEHRQDAISSALYLMDYDSFRGNLGRNGKKLGSSDYDEAAARSVFGDDFMRSHHLSIDNYADVITSQCELIISRIKQDVSMAYLRGEYMVYDTRKRILRVVEELSDYVSGNPAMGLEADLLKLRRLEGFDNKVIEFDSRGAINAKIDWVGGRNVLEISGSVYFKYPEIPEHVKAYIGNYEVMEIPDLKDRKKNALDGFCEWAGNYTVFGGQQVEVKVEVDETSSDSNSIIVNLVNHQDINYSISFGGKFLTDWSPEDNKKMSLHSGNVNLATHEFGHLLGLGDAYRSIPWFGPGVNLCRYPDAENTIMENSENRHQKPTNNGMEMVILAFKDGRRQEFQIGRLTLFNSISEALGKGN